jgi:hypothetical protein
MSAIRILAMLTVSMATFGTTRVTVMALVGAIPAARHGDLLLFITTTAAVASGTLDEIAPAGIDTTTTAGTTGEIVARSALGGNSFVNALENDCA